ncbi:MAG TPA: radical SAM protein [Acidobacteriota bacterium]|nr:radical SAM protein [Acidobacteriota bacterium]
MSSRPGKIRVVLIKPSKYSREGYVERFRRGFMPNSTLKYMESLTLEYAEKTGAEIETFAIDEYVHQGLEYLDLLRGDGCKTLVALVGIQSHQFHRALDLAALARKGGAQVVLGGPHLMTCKTEEIQNSGISISLAEAELVWGTILDDAIAGELQPVYGQRQRWQTNLEAPVLRAPSPRELKRYLVPMMGVYPARGCPFRCNFCSVIKIAGNQIRSQALETTLKTLRIARDAGVKLVMFTSDNFNKIPEVRELLREIIKEKLGLQFFLQCDVQIGGRDSDLVPLLARAGCYEIFVGVESFSRKVLLQAKKFQNKPEKYKEIIRNCREHGIATHFSNIIGFPGDTEKDVQGHLDMLRSLKPSQASFYILTPIPGTEQYDDFLSRGLIHETNLDRFDGTCETWQHDQISPNRLQDLLYYCYRKFYSLKELPAKNRLGCFPDDRLGGLPSALFARLCAWRRMHPMSGGIGRLRKDHVRDFLDLRRKTFDFSLAPLPESL